MVSAETCYRVRPVHSGSQEVSLKTSSSRETKVFVQISLLKDYSAALPNRGQDGLAKRVQYGDEQRQRISSQCLKAGYRSDQPMVVVIDGEEVPDDMRSFADRLGIGMSYRSRHVFNNVVLPQLAEDIGDEQEAKAWCRAFADLFLKEAAPEKEGKEPKNGKGDNGAKAENGSKPFALGYLDQPIVIGEKEVEAIISGIKTLRAKGVLPVGGSVDLRTLFEKKSAAKKAGLEDVVTNIRAVKAHAGLDGALFGRMTTGSVISRVDSCVHVAHAMTVHAIQASADYFSVQDTLTHEDDPGASHTNNTEIASGLFYEYVVIDVRQVVQNFASLTPEQQAEVVAWVVRAVYAAEASAKRGSTAGYGACLYFMAEVGSRQPRTLAAAFQKALPLRGTDPIWRRAVAALNDHRADLNLRGGAPKAAYDTEQEDIKQAARSSNRASFEVISGRVYQDVLPWLQANRTSAEVAE
jgi:CRISPR system Cascade subunit CasC